MSEFKLKKCPFCGGEAVFYRTPIKSNGGWCDSVVVRCKECEARTNRVIYNAVKHPNDEEYIEAAEAWNTRKPVEMILERLEEKEAECRERAKEELNEFCLEMFHAYENEADGIKKAIEIIKEEVG